MGAEFSAGLPATADREIQNHSRSRRCDSLPAINLSNAIHVAIGKPRDCRDIVPRANLGAIPAEVLDDISPIPEEIHDVAEIPSMGKPQGVAEFVKTRQVDDAFSQQCVSSCA